MLVTVFLLLSVIFAFTPPQFKNTEIVWQPTSNLDSGSLKLSRGWAEELLVETECQRLKGVEGILFDSGGTILEKNSDQVFLRSPQDRFKKITLQLPNDFCIIQVLISHKQSIVSLKVNEDIQEIHIGKNQVPIVNKLFIPSTETPTINKITIQTRSIGIENNKLRYSILLVLALIFFIIVILNFTYDKKLIKIKIKFSGLDLFVLGYLAIISFITPNFLDDGWVLARNDNYENSGIFSNIYDNNDAWLPQAHIWEMGLLLFRYIGFEFIHLRILIAFILFLSWYGLHHLIFKKYVTKINSHLFVPASVFLIFSSAWLMTIRPEPFIVFLAIFATVNVYRYRENNSFTTLIIIVTLSALALATHQTGVVLLGPLSVTAYFWFKSIEKARAEESIKYVLLGGSLSLIVVFLFLDVKNVLEGFREFSYNQSYYTGIFSETVRYNLVFQSSNIRVYSIVLMLIFLIVAFKFIDHFTVDEKILWTISILGTFALFLTSSKWAWHLGSYAFFASAYSGLAMKKLLIDKHNKSNLFIIISLTVAIIYAGATSLESSASWGNQDLQVLSWQTFIDTYGGSSNHKMWSLILILVVAVLIWGLHKNATRSISAIIAFILLVPLALTQYWIILDDRKSNGWTQLSQNIKSLRHTNYCGAFEETPIVTSDIEFTKVSDDKFILDNDLYKEGFEKSSTLHRGPLGTVENWGTYLFNSEENYLRTPIFTLGNERDLIVWTTSGAQNGIEINAHFIDSDGKIVYSEPLAVVLEKVWILNYLLIPEKANYVYFEIVDSNFDPDGWAAVSAPVLNKQKLIKNVNRKKSIFAGAFEYTNFPCINFPFPENGYWPKIDYVVEGTSFWNPSEFPELTLTEVGCSRYSKFCVYDVDYSMAKVSVIEIIS